MYSNGEPSTGRLFDAFIAAARGESRLAYAATIPLSPFSVHL